MPLGSRPGFPHVWLGRTVRGRHAACELSLNPDTCIHAAPAQAGRPSHFSCRQAGPLKAAESLHTIRGHALRRSHTGNQPSRFPTSSPAQPWLWITFVPSLEMPQGNRFNLLGLLALISDSTLLTTRERTQSMAWTRCSLNPVSFLSCASALAARGVLWPSRFGRVEGVINAGTGSGVGRREPEL